MLFPYIYSIKSCNFISDLVSMLLLLFGNVQYLHFTVCPVSFSSMMSHKRNYEGIEYTVHHTQDPVLQVILKKKNSGNKGSTALAYYYVARGNTFQAPDLCSLVSSRLVSDAAISHNGLFTKKKRIDDIKMQT